MPHPYTCPISFTYLPVASHVGHCPPQPVPVLGPAPTLSPTFLMAQAIFEPNFFPYDTPTFLKPSSFYIHLPAYEDGTVKSVTKRQKILLPTLRNYPEESIQHSEHGESLKSRI
jgi:hypothetical protein